MKSFVTAFTVALVTLFVPIAASAQDYLGGWDLRYVDAYGREVLYLGDNEDDTYLRLVGTRSYCVRPGASYSHMRNVVRGASNSQIYWWIDADCGSVIRVCVENAYGQSACSSYLDYGWVDG